MRKLFIFSIILSAYGCAGTIPTDTYVPQNVVRYNNLKSVSVGEFIYLPGEEGKLKSNQLKNTALGGIYLSSDISEMVRRATALELEKTGFMLDDESNYTIMGNVINFVADDLGYSVHWTYEIEYIIFKDSVEIFRKDYAPAMKKNGKFGAADHYAPVIHEIILNGYDMFIKDLEVRSILEKK